MREFYKKRFSHRVYIHRREPSVLYVEYIFCRTLALARDRAPRKMFLYGIE